MKRLCVLASVIFLVAGLFVSFAATESEAAPLNTSTFQIGGTASYSSAGDLLFPDISGPATTPHPLNTFGPFFVTGGLTYNNTWDLPDWSTYYDWNLVDNVTVTGSYTTASAPGSTPIDLQFTDTFNLGVFSLEDAAGGMTQAEVMDLITSLPPAIYEPGIGGYMLHPGSDFDNGGLDFALDDDYVGMVLDFLSPIDFLGIPDDVVSAELVFAGTKTLHNSTPPVPEPATMLLLGSGLCGIAGFRKRLRKKR